MKKKQISSVEVSRGSFQYPGTHLFKKLLCTALAGLVLMASCKKDSQETIADPPVPPVPFPTAEYVSASFEGKVVDEEGDAITGAKVMIGSSTVNTDASGFFKVQNANVDKHAAFIKVEKDGYFTGARTMVVKAGSQSEARISLIEKIKAGEFATASGGTVSVPENAGKVVFPAGAVINPATNQAYAGQVEVSARYINPTTENMSEIMPGEPRAIDAKGSEKILQTVSMLSVELTGANGEKLQLGNGKTATLTFPIPAALQAQAPATLSLYYFDEVKGLWKEEGTVTKEGTNYVGTVSHFSFWTCGYIHAPVDFEVTFKDESGTAIPSLLVLIKSGEEGNNTTVYGYGYTDITGNMKGRIPSGKSLKIVVLNRVERVLHSQVFATTTAASNLGIITISMADVPKVTFTGTVKNCADASVTNGFVAVRVDGQNYRTEIIDGVFSLTVPRLNTSSAEAVLIAYNQAETKGSDPKTITVTTGSAPLSHLTVCADPGEFVSVEVNGETLYYNDVKNVFNVVLDGISATNIEAYVRGKEDELGSIFSMAILGTEVGRYDLHSMTATDGTEDGTYWYFFYGTPPKVDITKVYEKDGVNYQEGEFTGTVTDRDDKPFTAHVKYKVKTSK